MKQDMRSDNDAPLYAERNPMELDRAGNYYCKHVMAMTKESLHSKSSIAMELGHRDMLIDAARLEAERLRGALTDIRDSNGWIGTDHKYMKLLASEALAAQQEKG